MSAVLATQDKYVPVFMWF